MAGLVVPRFCNPDRVRFACVLSLGWSGGHLPDQSVNVTFSLRENAETLLRAVTDRLENFSRFRCLFDFLHFSLGERELGSLHVFFQVRHRGGSGDRKHHGAAVQQPGDGKLRDGGSLTFRDFVQLPAGARELAGCHREPGDEGDVVAFAVFENIFMLAVADVV